MKKLIKIVCTTIIAFTFLMQIVYAQTADYYTVVDSLTQFYENNPSLKSQHEGGYTQFVRWQEFWRDRVYGQDTTKRGSLGLWLQAIEDFDQSQDRFSATPIAATWQVLGPVGVTGQWNGLVSAVYVDTVTDSTLNTIYIGTNASGIWKTTDGGGNWTNLLDETLFPNLGILDITGDPSTADIIYAASGGSWTARPDIPSGRYGIGILKSTNGGQSWTRIWEATPSSHSQVFKLLIDPFNTDRMYALIDTCVMRTQNGGVTWTKIFDQLEIYYDNLDFKNLKDIEMKPGDSNTLYIASDDYNGWQNTAVAELWKTSNATAANPTWTRLDTLLLKEPDTIHRTTEQYEIAVSPADPSAVWVLCNSFPQDSIMIWKSMDSGNSWNLKYKIANNKGVGYDKIEMEVSPVDTGNLYYFGVTCAKMVNWIEDTVVFAQHEDIRASFILNRNAPGTIGSIDTLYLGTDGGISLCTSEDFTFENINGEGLIITQFYGIAGARKIPFDVYGGTQDNCFFGYHNGNWTRSGYGDYGNTVVDYQNTNYIYTMVWPPSAEIVRSDNSGATWTSGYDPTYGENAVYNKPLEMNPINPKTLYTGGHNLFKSINQADTFTIIPVPGNISSGEKIGSICVAPSDTSVIYIAFTNPNWSCANPVKLIKTSNEGATWVSLVDSLEILWKIGITDIEVSPNDADSVWISFGGFDVGWTNPDSIHNRVYFSDDGGTSWEDISPGLPNFPVNCIKFNPESNGGLFAGTDIGVFYYDNDQSHWIPFNTGLPQTIITDFEINDSLSLIKASTFGRGIYESDISCFYDEDSLVISKNTTWKNDTVVDRSIIVDSLVTFTIEGRVAFPTMAKIMVKCGGKLIVDGGTLTNACFRNWLGIEVWGNSSVNQSPVDNQGFVWLKNGAVLENARIGITTCRKDSKGEIMWNTTGGIIISDSATFQNNYKAIEFLSYRYRHLSSFKRTIFQTTRTFIDAYNWYPSDFISLYDVSGVTFKGCILQNTTCGTLVPNNTKGQGIYSIEAQYEVDTYCTSQSTPCPTSAMAPSVFTGLFYGIKAINYETGNNLKINKATFTNNTRGAYLSVCNNSQITSNTISVPNHATAVYYDTTYGLYLDGSTGYKVEENIFRKMDNYQTSDAIGLIVNNSDTVMNEIYNNQFDTLKYAFIGQDQNRSSDGMTGLVLRCNDYHNNNYDMVIALSDTSQSDWGIALYQGDSITMMGPAANTFSPQHTSGVSDIDNEGARLKYYHHHQNTGQLPRVKPSYNLNVAVRPTAYTYNKDTCCPSTLTGGGGGSQEDLKQMLAAESNTISTKETQLIALVDGGSTEDLNTEILTSIPAEALELRNALLGESPYLSDTTMQSAIAKEDVLPNEMIRDILVANPQSALSDKVLEELNNRFVPMADQMMAEILAGEEIISAKETLEAELVSHKVKRARVLNDLIRIYKNDTENQASFDSLIVLLQNESDLTAKYQLAFEFLRAGDTNNVNSTLSVIPTTYSLSQKQSNVHSNYLNYFSVMKNMLKNHSNIFTIDSALLPAIHSLYSSGTGSLKSFARNILIARGEINYHEPILLPDALKSSTPVRRYRTGQLIEKSYMKVFPNPAKQFVIVEYNLQEKYSDKNEVILILTNLNGSHVSQRILVKQQDQELIETTGLISGTYICSLFVNGKILESKKLVILE